jgi:hypothetical protein
LEAIAFILGIAVPQPARTIGTKVVKQIHTVERMMPHSFKTPLRLNIGDFPRFPSVVRKCRHRPWEYHIN